MKVLRLLEFSSSKPNTQNSEKRITRQIFEQVLIFKFIVESVNFFLFSFTLTIYSIFEINSIFTLPSAA